MKQNLMLPYNEIYVPHNYCTQDNVTHISEVKESVEENKSHVLPALCLSLQDNE